MGWQTVVAAIIIAGNQTIINSSGEFVYNGAPAHGNLVASITPLSGTDPQTNKYQAGVNGYVTISGTTYAIGLNQSGGSILSPGVSVQDVNNPPFSAPGFFAQGSGGTPKQALSIATSGQSTNTDAQAFTEWASQTQSSVTGGLINHSAALTQVNGALEIDGAQIPQAQMQSASGNQHFPDPTNVQPMRYSSGTFGDGQAYAYGKKTIQGRPNQLVNSTSPVQVSTATTQVAVGPKYRVEVDAVFSTTATAGNALFGFDGGSVVNGNVDGFNVWYGPAMIYETGGYIIAMPVPLAAGPTFTSGNHRFHEEFYVTFSTGGTFNFRTQCGNAADTFTIDNFTFIVEPV